MRIEHLTLVILFLFSSCKPGLINHKIPIEVFATSKTTLLGVKSNNFRGTIFTDKYPFTLLHVSDIDSLKRFTPTLEELQEAEYILSRKLQFANRSRMNQSDDNQIIHKNLNKYFRQYVGFFNKKGDKIIHINFHWNEYTLVDNIRGSLDTRLKYDSDYSTVFDGGSYYWEINVNLTKNKLSDLQVNGTS
ncbi:hypothetical protein H8B13_02400 [Hymenobacter sp. BT188]|uniref:hypothetical protein n=1 Tax=Hymenobacter sp. BT188 TaxID=2763504 RepID=UPI0016515BB7|nr:hypothetical protein [Hymenobacter sp. BT188]MBC6605660.1 hypothetical protein [Hymenobacter sp. BT188]